jgi:hypothetical protein
MMNEQMQQMDYNLLLMNHLNRLSFVTTSSFIDAFNGNPEIGQKVSPMGEKSLEWGVHFLYCIIPDDLLDAEFKKDRQEYLKMDIEHSTMQRDFVKLRAVVNLLNRKGLLLSKQIPARRGKKEDAGEEWDGS